MPFDSKLQDTERRPERFLLAMGDAVRAFEDPQAITVLSVRMLGEYLAVDRCAYAEVAADADTLHFTGDYSPGGSSIVGQYRFSELGPDALSALREGEPYVVANVDTHEPPIADLTRYRQASISALILVPLHKAGRIVAAMAVHQREPRCWTKPEVDLVHQVVSRCWEAIERARVTQQLLASERRFRAAVAATNSIVWTNNVEGKMRGEQPGWERFTGQTREEYLDFGWAKAVHPDDVQPTLDAWNRVVERREPFVFEHRLRRADGEYRTCAIRAVPVLDGGDVKEWVGVHTDVTAQRTFEHSLQESETRFRAMSDSAPVMIWMTRPDGHCEYLNAQWYDFTGQTEAEATGFGWLSAVHPDDMALAQEAFRDANARGGPFKLEYRLLRKDGQYRWCIDAATPRRTKSGEFLGYIGSVVDMTERKQMEDALAAEKRVLELIATGSPLAEVLKTLALGVEAQSIDGLLCSILMVDESGERLVHGAAPSLPPAYNEAIHGLAIGPNMGSCGTAAHERRPIVVADIANDPRWAASRDLALEHGLRACSSMPIMGTDGQVLGTVAMYYPRPCLPSAHDFALNTSATHLASIVIEKHLVDLKLKDVLEAERHARSEAERASRMKDEFLATLSHELRTPISSILGWSQIVKAARSQADIDKGMTIIERNARAQVRIIEELLDMSSIISGKVRIELHEVDLLTLVQSTIETARPTAEAKNVRIHAQLDAKASMLVRGDPNRLQQVFWNLLSNAIKFTPRDGKIEVSLKRDDAQIAITVSDNGQGIGAEFLPFVFDRFRQADGSSTRGHGGLGLGLSIVKQLVELHGGSASVVSQGPGRGATFTVTLPALRARVESLPDAEQASPVNMHERISYHSDVSGLRVLVVDDEQDAREWVKRLLEEGKANVAMAGSADEALHMIERQTFDVLVSDIGMPGEDGLSFIRRVRQLRPEHGGDIPAVALTAYARASDRLGALRAGFQMHACKPIEPSELLAVVASLGNGRDAARHARQA